MEVKIENNEVQKLLDRSLITGKIIFEGKATPSRMSIIENLAKQLKIDKNLVIIYEIKTIFGSTIANFEAHIYDSIAAKNKVEPKYMVKRSEPVVKKPVEEKKEESAPTKEVPADKPVEKKKEEAVKEKKEEAASVEEAKPEEKKEEASAEEKK